jgi:hypothetical protein
MAKAKQRIFKLIDLYLSSNTDKTTFAKNYSLPSSFTVYDGAGKPTTHALAPSKTDTNIDTWKEIEGTLNHPNRPRLEKPTFVDGFVICAPRGSDIIKANYLAASPWCVNGINADPSRATFYEVKPEEEAMDRAMKRKLERNCAVVIDTMSDDQLEAYCMVKGIRTKDGNGDVLERVLLEDHLMQTLEIKSSYEEFLEDQDDRTMDIKILIARGLSTGKLSHDKSKNALSFQSGSTVFAAAQGLDIIDEASKWVDSTEEGKNFFKALKLRVTIREAVNEVEEDEEDEFNGILDESGIMTMEAKDLFEVAYNEYEVIKHHKGKGFFIGDEQVETIDGKIAKSKEACIEALATNEDNRLKIANILLTD